jgi:hypothetical protein
MPGKIKLTPNVMRAGKAEVCIQKAIQLINTDRYVGIYALKKNIYTYKEKPEVCKSRINA